MTVGELGQRMSSAEFAEWIAYSSLEPFGPRREDLRAALVASTVFNVNRGPKGRFFQPEEFLGLSETPSSDRAETPSAQTLTDKARSFFFALADKSKGPPH